MFYQSWLDDWWNIGERIFLEISCTPSTLKHYIHIFVKIVCTLFVQLISNPYFTEREQAQSRFPVPDLSYLHGHPGPRLSQRHRRRPPATALWFADKSNGAGSESPRATATSNSNFNALPIPCGQCEDGEHRSRAGRRCVCRSSTWTACRPCGSSSALIMLMVDIKDQDKINDQDRHLFSSQFWAKLIPQYWQG